MTFCVVLAGKIDMGKDLEEDRLLDKVMLRLRLADGLDLRDVEAEFGKKRADLIRKAVEGHELKKTVHYDGCTIRLTDPEGYLFSNDIISDIFAKLDTDPLYT